MKSGSCQLGKTTESPGDEGDGDPDGNGGCWAMVEESKLRGRNWIMKTDFIETTRSGTSYFRGVRWCRHLRLALDCGKYRG